MRMKTQRTTLPLLLAGLVVWSGVWAAPNAPTMNPEPEYTAGLSNTVSWSNESASGAVQYFVGASTDSTFPDPQQIDLSSGWISGTSYTFDNVLQDGVKYYYRVRARDAGLNMSPWSAPVWSIQDASGPPPVTDLEAVGRLEYIRLTWTPVQDAGIGTGFYRVYRSTAQGVLGDRIDAGDNTVTLPFFADQTADTAVTYWYTVRPVDLFGQETLQGNNQDDAAIQMLGAPTLTITWPTDRYVTCEDSIDVRGLFTNTVSIWVNGEPARMTLDPVAGEFSALDIPLAIGPNVILAQGNGTFGRTTSDEIVVIRLPSCEPEPSIAITFPEDGSFHGLGTVAVTGTVENVGAVRILDQWVDIEFGPDFTTGTFLFPAYPLHVLGEISIVTTGYGTPPPGELIDREVTDEVTVYVVAPGTLAVQITSPQDGAILGARAVDVAGTFAGAFKVEVNGIEATLDPDALTFLCPGVPLVPGPNEIRAVATGLDMATVEDVITVYVVEGTPPTVEITFPPDRYVTSEQVLGVTGTSTNTAWIEVTYAGGPVVTALPDPTSGAWQAPLALPSPYAALTITATAYGLDATAQDQVTVYVVGTAAPSISITYPPDGAAVNASPVVVTGTAQNVGFVEVNGLPAQYDVPNFQCAVSLTDGWNTIVARGFGVSQVVADTVRVWYESGCVTDPGSIAITAPLDSFITTASTIDVMGTSSCIRSVTVNGVVATIDYATGAWTASEVPLAMGANTMTAVGTNYAGGTVTASRTVFRVGTGAPAISITSPTNGQEFAYQDSMIVVTGTSANVAYVKVNGILASLSAETGNWTLSGFHLNVGDNVIRAVGYGTQEVSATVTVRRHPRTAPPEAKFHAIITPNGDGYNDVANIPVSSLTSTVTIFARDGQRIVELRGNVDQRYSELFIHWDGKDASGVVVPSGVYIFQVDNIGSVTTGTVVVAR